MDRQLAPQGDIPDDERLAQQQSDSADV